MRLQVIRNQSSVGLVARNQRGEIIAAIGAKNLPEAVLEILNGPNAPRARSFWRAVKKLLRKERRKLDRE